MTGDHTAVLRAKSEVKKALKDGGRRAALRWVVSVSSVLALILLAACLSGCGSFRDVAELIPRDVETQTISIGEGMNSATPTGSLSATGTAAPLQPATPPPSQNHTLTYTFFPAIVNSSVPAAMSTEQPPIETIDSTPPTDTSLTPTKAPFTKKTILVDISDQHVYAYEKGMLIFSFIASTGRKNSTRAGHYKILDKHPRAFSDLWGFWMPYWMGFEYVGNNLENGFHSLPVLSNGVQLWGKKIGKPITYGCVVLKPNDMKKLYRWAGIGTAVVIQK